MDTNTGAKMSAAIPKIIHYIWLGGKEKPNSLLECLASWKKYCPDYQIIEWNETNFIKGRHPLVDMAIEAHNWAFAADIIRVTVLNEHGGIYVDTDMELLANPDAMLNYDCFMCYEAKYWVGTAILGSKPHHPVFEKLVHRYDQEHGITFYSNPFSVHAVSAILRYFYKRKMNGRFSVNDNIALLSSDYFYPINYVTFKEKRTKNTLGVHHYVGSWHSKKQKRGFRFAAFSRKILGRHIYGWFEKLVANNFYHKIRKQLRKMNDGY